MAIDWEAASGADVMKLWACIGIDILDCTVGRLPGFGIVFDTAAAGVASMMWGWQGLNHLWEIIDITEQIDGFIPTATIIAWKSMQEKYPLREAGDVIES